MLRGEEVWGIVKVCCLDIGVYCMLTRLKVSGFKNLVDVDVRFGPFTCIAGANGVGKSNLFDAIKFLSALADRPLIEAVAVIRNEGERIADVHSLFHRVGKQLAKEISFEVEMIIPEKGVDDLGQNAEASITFLRYSLVLRLREDEYLQSLGSLEIQKEELSHINIGDGPKNLLFDHKPGWRRSAIKGRRTSPFISTEGSGETRIIKRHQDGNSGRPLRLSAVNLPRTVLSVANAAESPTALLARREMQSWRLLQLEPSALRKPDEYNAPSKLGEDGAHLAATLFHLAKFGYGQSKNGKDNRSIESKIYSRVANRLAELINDVHDITIDQDERRELLTLQVTDKYRTTYPARSLSDGTLRFLALAVIEQDPQTQGLLCLEEPENGIHPERIPAMLKLLQEIATDTTEPIGFDNPLRQVLVNTHSPAVVTQVLADSLLLAELKESIRNGSVFKRVTFSGLSNTWRTNLSEKTGTISKGNLIAYLNPILKPEEGNTTSKKQRVADRPDFQPYLPMFHK